jgi:hypothetical protein
MLSFPVPAVDAEKPQHPSVGLLLPASSWFGMSTFPGTGSCSPQGHRKDWTSCGMVMQKNDSNSSSEACHGPGTVLSL